MTFNSDDNRHIKISERLETWIASGLARYAPDEEIQWDVTTMVVQTPEGGQSIGAGIAIVAKGVLIGTFVPLIMNVQSVLNTSEKEIHSYIQQGMEGINQARSQQLSQAGGQTNGDGGLHLPGQIG